jgi:hypothetical protein
MPSTLGINANAQHTCSSIPSSSFVRMIWHPRRELVCVCS